jgi:transposase
VVEKTEKSAARPRPTAGFRIIIAAGAELRYLPPYSPDMNPIEKAY